MASATALNRPVGKHDPQRQCRGADADHDEVEARHRRRQPSRIFARQPVAREARHDAAADHRDQQHHGGDADADTVFSAAMEMGLEMKSNVAGEQQAHQANDFQVSPILARENLARNRGDQQRKKSGINESRRQPADFGRECDGDTPRQPQCDQNGQGRTLDRQPPGPVRNRGEQKSGHHRRQIAVQHFVDVPVDRPESCPHLQFTIENR
jgi:hypothetical protein